MNTVFEPTFHELLHLHAHRIEPEINKEHTLPISAVCMRLSYLHHM